MNQPEQKTKLLNDIMQVLTYFDTSVQAYITPDQEPFVRKELEKVLSEDSKYLLHQLIEARFHLTDYHYANKILTKLIDDLISDAINYTKNNPK